MTRICLDCSKRYQPGDPYRCRPCYLNHQKARNDARPQYAGAWRRISRTARQRQPWCSVCGTPYRLTLDHEHGQVECVPCNSSHRRDPA